MLILSCFVTKGLNSCFVTKGLNLNANSVLLCCKREANTVLAAETQMFEKYLSRSDRPAVKPDFKPTITAPGMSTKDAAYRKRSKSHSTAAEKLQKLTSELKCDIASKEIEERREEIRRLDEDAEKVIDTFKVCTPYITLSSLADCIFRKLYHFCVVKCSTVISI